MIRATPPIAPLNVDLITKALDKKLTLTDNQESSPKKGRMLRSVLSWIWSSRIPQELSPRSIVDQMKCSPRSYHLQLDQIAKQQENPLVMLAYLTKAVNSLSLKDLTASPYFWTNRNIEYVCELLSDRPDEYRQLLELTPASYYIVYPGLCKSN